MTPHGLRHIYDTFLDEQDADPAVRKSAAVWMKHSEKTARKHYTHSSIEKQLKPASEFNQRYINAVFLTNS